MGIALVTGGTSGIGATFARQLAAKGEDIVLVARDRERLEQMAHELRGMGREVEVLPADLSKRADVARVVKRLEDPQRPIDMLVNNAGFGMHSQLSDADSSGHDFAFEVMMRSVRELGAASARAMRARGRGRIINVSSTAGFVAMSSGYSAVKAWVTSFSEGLSNELHGTGVTVMALCPGWVHTEFHERAGISKGGIPGWLWLDADKLVRSALRDAERGTVISIPSVRYKLLMGVVRHLPRSAVRRISRAISSSRTVSSGSSTVTK
ncbi:SDR family NAD(P)-dependent oxidoreductase [Pseudolysinimonas sp.]|uniref:SDR family NAD(P)-dependent oxidoreductase n=1 Tax=Pseudolysinimonas sp. TaxID=2680009 RepID=UPI00286AEF70|nr:SDR family NAD(P)-dependent oxidoreductase [Pseudolysinimonas sp.]